MNILELLGIPYYKKGSGIHIKKKNRGKFTDYCGGKVTQECIDKAKKSGNATLKKRAVFAENARAWKHQKGGEVYKRLDLKSLRNDPEYKKRDLYLEDKNLEIIQDSLINRNIGFPQRVATLTSIIAENGGRTTPHGNGAYGLVGWRGSRAKNLPEDLGGQIHKLMVELFENPKAVDWTHGGPGGAATGAALKQRFMATPNVAQAVNDITKGYVRPGEDRSNLGQIIKRHMK